MTIQMVMRILVTEVSNTENKPSRNTVAQCYEAIIKDLKEGADLLDEAFNKGKINKRCV